MAFTPDSKKVVSISQDKTVRVWDIVSGKEEKKLGPTEDDLYGLAFSRDGKQFATSGYAGWLKVWDLTGGKTTFSKKLKQFGAYCVVFTPDGKFLITGHDKKPGDDKSKLLITPVK